MDLGAIVLSVVFCVTLLACGLVCFFAVQSQAMSDEEREKTGLGPKGQGRR